MGAIDFIERDILLWVQNNLRTGFLDEIMKIISFPKVSDFFWVALTIILLCIKRTRRIGIYTAAALLLEFIVLNLILKPLVARVRPYDSFPEIICLVRHASDLSFPSGHSGNALAFAWAMHRLAPKRWVRVLSMTFALIMAFSRIYVGIHYLTDVLVGMSVGIVMSEIALCLTRRVENKLIAKRG